jgi:uncharacterized protein
MLVSLVLVLVIVGVFLLLALIVLLYVLPIVAGVAANRGTAYRYPLAIRLVR